MMNLNRKDYEKFANGLLIRANYLFHTNLLGTYPIRFGMVPHFVDRLMDRNACLNDLRDISEVMAQVLNKEICMLLYGIHLEDTFRVNFKRDQLLIGLTLNEPKTKLILRTVMFDRVHDGRQKSFDIKV